MKPAARAYASLLLAASTMGLGVGCGGDEAEPGGGGGGSEVDSGSSADAGADAGPVATDDSWTFFVYGHGDNTLSNSLIRDMGEMMSAKLGGKVNVVVLADYDASQVLATDGVTPFPTGSEWYLIPGDEQEPELIDEEPEQNLDDPAVLSASIAKAFTLYPAAHHALVLWDHGGSWRLGFGGDTDNGSIQQPKGMTPAVVAAAVKAGLDQAGIDKPLDLFSFDACLMAGAEVAWEFREVADVYIGDAEIDYGDGWDYAAFLTHLASHAGDSAAALGAAEVATWDAHHVGASANDAILRSHIALDMKKLVAFGDAFATFSTAWRAQANFGEGGAARALYFSLPPYMNELAGLQGEPELRDMGQFLNQIVAIDNTDVGAKAQAALTALQAATLATSQGEVRVAAGQYAMHAQLPVASSLTQETYELYIERSPAWLAQTHWDDALFDYANSNDGVEPTVNSAVATKSDGNFELSFASADSDVAEVNVFLGRFPDQATTIVQNMGLLAKGMVIPTTLDDPYGMTWYRDATVIQDSVGTLHAIAPVVWEDLGSNFNDGSTRPPLLAVRGFFEPQPGEAYPAVILYEDGASRADTLTLVDPPITFSFSEVRSDYPGSTFTPVFEVIDFAQQTSTYEPSEPIAIDLNWLDVGTNDVLDGEYLLLTEITDVFGNTGSDVQSVIVQPQP
jgi:Clostripain family